LSPHQIPKLYTPSQTTTIWLLDPASHEIVGSYLHTIYTKHSYDLYQTEWVLTTKCLLYYYLYLLIILFIWLWILLTKRVICYFKSTYKFLTRPGISQLFPQVHGAHQNRHTSFSHVQVSRSYFLTSHGSFAFQVKIFFWLLFRNMLLTNDNLRKRHWSCGTTCVLGSLPVEEDAKHLFLSCNYARRLWYDELPRDAPTPKDVPHEQNQ
jgi:zinc-binding in reverse transcriptase